MKNVYVVAALIREGNKIFATQRGYGDFKGGWEFPGGKVKEGESPQEALKREIYEELNTEISVGRLYETVEYDYPDFHLKMDCFWATVIKGDLELKEHMDSRWLTGEEIGSLDWLPADESLVSKLEKEGFAIKNLVFDIGGVLLQYRWRDMFREYGLSEEESERVGWQVFNSEAWTLKFDRGTIDHEELIKELAETYPADAAPMEWFVRHGDEMKIERREIWDLVGNLKEKGYKIYLLSNYSEYLSKLHFRDAEFMNYLDGEVISYEPHFVKPEPEIYHYLVDKYQLNMEECLFFDDRLENVKGAHAVGMDAVVVTSREMLGETLQYMLNMASI